MILFRFELVILSVFESLFARGFCTAPKSDSDDKGGGGGGEMIDDVEGISATLGHISAVLA